MATSSSKTHKASLAPAREQFIIRPARLTDFRTLAIHNADVYRDHPVTNFLTPYANTYPEDQIRSRLQGIQQRYTRPDSITAVACRATRPDVPIGYAQYRRVGSDGGPQAVAREKGLLMRAWLWLLSWVFWAMHAASNRLWKTRITDARNLKLFGEYIAADQATHWSRPAWQDRWFLESVVVAEEFQGKGVGKLLLKDLIERAERERVVIGLSSSPQGEHLYRKLGFELMGDFSTRIKGEVDLRGGIMIRYPEGWEGERHEKYIGYFDLHRSD